MQGPTQVVKLSSHDSLRTALLMVEVPIKTVRSQNWSFISALVVFLSLSTSAETQASGAAYVQVAAKVASGTASSLSVSFPANTNARDLVLVAFDYSSSVTPSSVTDSQGNTFTPVGNQLTSPSADSRRVYYAKNIKGGADTVTVTLSGKSGWLEVI